MSVNRNNFRCGAEEQSTGLLAKQRGSSLIEVMVALFIMAVGLMGVLGMQANGVRSNTRAVMMTDAQMLAGDMANMLTAYSTISSPASDDYVNLESDRALARVNCEGGCTREEQLNHDLSNWSQDILERLPGGVGTAVFSPVTNMYRITMMWDSEGTGAIGRGCGTDPEVDLTCYVLEVQI